MECDEIKREVENFKKAICMHNEKSPNYPVQVSIGFSWIKHSQGNIREVVKNADKNMFNEKMRTKDANGRTQKINNLY